MKRLTDLLAALVFDLETQGNAAGATICQHAIKEIERLDRVVDSLLTDEEAQQ